MPTESRSPSRAEFNRLLERVDALAREVNTAKRELGIQFDRMAQLQADIDLIRAALTKVKLPKSGD